MFWEGIRDTEEVTQLKIALGADHAGFRLKEILKKDLMQAGYEVQDFGTASEEMVDYPDFAEPAAKAVAEGRADKALLMCGNGVGVCMTANKIPGVRAVLTSDTYTARTSREHNDTNVLCMGGRVVGPELAREIARVWLSTDFSGDERHVRRLGKLKHIEEQKAE